jgi:hypothetical protein
MRVQGTDRPIERPEGTEAALQRYAHMALVLGLSGLGVAGVYFTALYLLAH